MQYQRILSAVRHFDETTNLDERAYHLTVHLPIKNFTDLRKPIYFKVARAFGQKSYGYGPKRPGMLLNEDMVGSRFNGANGFGYHFHAIIFSPTGSPLKEEFRKTLLQLFLADLHIDVGGEKVFHKIQSDVRRYEMDDCLAGLAGYNSKLDRQHSGEAFNQLLYSVEYPWEFDRNSRGHPQRKVDMQARYFNLLDRFADNPNQFFSERYVHEFGERLAEVAELARSNSQLLAA